MAGNFGELEELNLKGNKHTPPHMYNFIIPVILLKYLRMKLCRKKASRDWPWCKRELGFACSILLAIIRS